MTFIALKGCDIYSFYKILIKNQKFYRNIILERYYNKGILTQRSWMPPFRRGLRYQACPALLNFNPWLKNERFYSGLYKCFKGSQKHTAGPNAFI